MKRLSDLCELGDYYAEVKMWLVNHAGISNASACEKKIYDA
jgi:hypothetical protein